MKLILVRHGQSTYNLENKFTGWKDVGLTARGYDEAKSAGDLLKKNNIRIDMAFTSNLKRAQITLDIILERMNINLDIIRNTALNERDYGDLIGQNKADAAVKFGREQVQIWRRSFDIPPPGGESLKMTCDRTLPYFNKILDKVMNAKNVIVSAHGNSIRAIIMQLFDYSPDLILKTEIGWCEPWVIDFNDDKSIKNFNIMNIHRESKSNVPQQPKLF